MPQLSMIQDPVKSVYYSNYDIITSIMSLYNINSFDLDPTYSKGAFWKGINKPRLKYDLRPLTNDCLKASSDNLQIESNSISSIMFDPPFVISGKTYLKNKEGSSITAKRFHGYTNYESLKKHYYPSLKEFYRILRNKGILVFKCQDTVSSGKNHFTHNMVMDMALHVGFYPKDLFILLANNRINSFGGKWKKQQHARKYHSYFWVFIKEKQRVNYNF